MDLRYVAGVLLLAMVPMALYATGQTMVAAVSLVNIVIIYASLYVMFGPAESPHGHSTH
ncbi:cytochrome-ba3 oxidase subunit [Salinarchaeum sp. Harcht-Bsk1]|uniref:cytochrome-ba3 oxidase subunit n=1 Tax=Salinarchaeum sp. Harcht-Bsk1 TaxID=1333523 RepID=UPI001181BF5D|nr:cytochrome-ba3 oxidase subunit [Salinarchaeum sp. Harcht-Bsk1]